jgi:hypothetical protein
VDNKWLISEAKKKYQKNEKFFGKILANSKIMRTFATEINNTMTS